MPANVWLSITSPSNVFSSNSGEFPPVKSRFPKLNSEHIGYVMDSLKSNTAKIGNIKAYTLAALYNAPVTMGQYYTSLVSHDMAHGLLDG